jgi:hypothetical protein
MMKRIWWMIPCTVLFGALALWAERAPTRQETPVSLQFVAKLFGHLREVAPQQEANDKNFEKELRALLTKAKSLQTDFHRAEQGGMRQEGKKEMLRADGKKLVLEALTKTEDYLVQVLANLKAHRSELSEKLLSKK